MELKNICRQIINIGASPAYDSYRNRQVRALNLACLVGAVTCFVIGAMAFSKGRTVPFLIQLSRIALCAIAICLNAYHQHKLAKAFALIAFVSTNLLFIFFVPYQTSSSLSYVLMYIFVFYFYARNQNTKWIFFFLMVLGSVSYYYELGLENKFPNVHFISFVSISVVGYLLLNYYQREHYSYQGKLELQNQQLQSQNAQIIAQSEEIKKQKLLMKQQHQALEEEKNLLLDAQGMAKLGNWEYNVESGTLNWSDTTFEILGMGREEFTPDAYNYTNFIKGEFQSIFEEAQGNLIKNGIPYEIEIEHKRADGSVASLLIKAKAVREKGRTIKVIGTLLDNSERKEREKKLHQLNDSKDRILSTVAHDLRSPINHIQGLVSILEMQQKNITKEDEEVFNKMKASCQKGLSLINELLEIAMLEDENFKLEKKPVDLQDLLCDTIQGFMPSIHQKGINLHVHFPSERVKIMLNKEKFARVLENLISNAIKFTPRRGSIMFTAREEQGGVLLKIQDTGIGIPDELQATLFEKFSKASRAGLDGEKSVGLGMSIVKQIIDLHKGKISVKSKVNSGTCFCIHLPKE